jgi:hypothetical protein
MNGTVHFKMATNELVRLGINVVCDSLIIKCRHCVSRKTNATQGWMCLFEPKQYKTRKYGVGLHSFVLISLHKLAQQHTQYELYWFSVLRLVRRVPENSANAKFLAMHCQEQFCFLFHMHSQSLIKSDTNVLCLSFQLKTMAGYYHAEKQTRQ